MAADSLLAALLCAAVVLVQQQRRAAWEELQSVGREGGASATPGCACVGLFGLLLQSRLTNEAKGCICRWRLGIGEELVRSSQGAQRGGKVEPGRAGWRLEQRLSRAGTL